ncbi:MAG: stalk domain-containing protein [Clostridia bacterium]|nr:stalk domain-containing protein [Clostridia bacterium]
MKKIISGCLCTAIIAAMCNVGVYAYEPPKEIWSSFNKYAAAIESKDYENIIKYGLMDVEILEKEPVNETTQSWLCARYQHIGEAYEKLGDYDNSALMYEKQIPIAKAIGWTDSEKIARAKSLNYKSNIQLYTKTTGAQVNFGAINEQLSGVLFGISADSSTDQTQCSMQLVYLEYGDTKFDWIKSVLRAANENGKAIEFAFNMPNQGSDLSRIINDTAYLNNLADMLAQYPNVKYFFRFGGEVDIWENRADPEEYKKAFITTADIIHAKVKNAAMVFSPNMVSSWDRDMMDYYPGDEYADWIGLSLYMMKYFQGIADRSEDTKYMEVVFASGDSAEPVLMLKKFIDTFGDRKPILISESGASHYIRTANEYDTEWAASRLKMLYKFVPMVYPQVKLIAHFDTVISNEVNDYSLKDNQTILQLYKELTSDDIFIKKSANNTVDISYKPLGDTIYTDGSPMEISAYAHVFGKTDLKVNYYIDGKWIAGTSELPYTKTIDMSTAASGEHTLKVTCESGGKEVYSKNFKLIGQAKQPGITIYVDGKEIICEQPPVIKNDRTMVPLREIFEALGADVEWNGETRTATATKGSEVVSIQIDQKQLFKNGNAEEIDTAACIINNRTMVPARAVAQAFGANVEWNGAEKKVLITTK